jgi:hypothetical protein
MELDRSGVFKMKKTMKKLELLKIIKEEVENVLTELWKSRLRKNYDDDYEQFVQYDSIYNIAARLGFESTEDAWDKNPMIQGGVNPKDLKVVSEFITSGNELEILDNAARDINKDFFNNRADYNPMLHQMTVRDSADSVVKILDKKTDIKKRGKGFTAKADEAQEYYELPDYNVSISFDQYKMSRGTTIQFLDFDGELPEKATYN